MLIIFLCIVAIIAGYLMFDRISDTVGVGLMMLGGGFLLIFGIFFIVAHIPTIEANTKTQYEEKYKAVMYILQNDKIPGSDIISQISQYNSDILQRRRYNASIWFKDYTFDFYDELPLIELEDE